MSNQESLANSRDDNLSAVPKQQKPFIKSKSTLIKSSIEDYHLGDELGRGSYGKVVMATCKKTQKTYAIKRLDKEYINQQNKINEVFAERKVLETVKHSNIIKLIQTFQSQSELFYVLEYCNNGSLKELIEKNGPLTFPVAQYYTAEIVNVLKYFEEKSLAHRDIKPGNIMLDDNLHLKFIDFGTATIVGNRFDLRTKKFVKKDMKNETELVGTPEYASPEMLNLRVTNEKSCDIWALGCVIYQLFHGRTPFKGDNEKSTIEKVKAGHFTIEETLDASIKDLIKKLLVLDENQRLGMSNIKDIMSHPFFEGINFEELNQIPVPKLPKSKSLFCLNRNQTLIKEAEDNYNLYTDQELSDCFSPSLYMGKRKSTNTTCSSSTVVSHRNSQNDEEYLVNFNQE